MRIKYTSSPVFIDRAWAIAYALCCENEKFYRICDREGVGVYLYDVLTNLDGGYEDLKKYESMTWPVLETFALDGLTLYRFEIENVHYWTHLGVDG